jgi:glycosyltransferase involved in cell wall biosynthesis
MDLNKLTVLILTYNEAPNIGRTLGRLGWAREVVVVDSFSTDETVEILGRHANVRVVPRKFDTHARQWNFGLAQVESEWVLSLDADYVLSDELVKELAQLDEKQDVDGYQISFKYCVFGRALRSTILPPRLALFRKAYGTYIDDGHTQLLKVDGQSSRLNSFIYHDDRKPLGRWLWAQNRYVLLEQAKLRASPPEEDGPQDRLRRTKVIAPLLVLAYCLVVRRGVLDGWAGLYYAYQRALAEALLAIRLIEAENLRRDEDLGQWVREQDAEQKAAACMRIEGIGQTSRARLFAPLFMLPYRLLICGDILAGWRGWHSAYRRLFCSLLLSLYLIEMKTPRAFEGGADDISRTPPSRIRSHTPTKDESSCTRA